MQQEAIQPLQPANADTLPTLPHILLRLLDACHDESVSFEHMASVISKDPALCLKILSACGADCTSRDNLEKSLARLGINAVKSIAITAAVRQFFSPASQARSAFLKQHWYHSIYSACIAEQLADAIGYKYPCEAWYAGLLHDAGQLVMENTRPERYSAEPVKTKLGVQRKPVHLNPPMARSAPACLKGTAATLFSQTPSATTMNL